MTSSPLLPTSTERRPTVVLLHASASSSRQWDQLAQALRPSHDVHAIDLHGHGRREAWTDLRPLSLHDDAALALKALERQGGGHLVGHSYGGAVALHLAAMQPSLVHSLAVYEPVVFSLLADKAPDSHGAREAFAIAAGLHALVGQGRPEVAGEVFVDYWSGPGTWRLMGQERQRAIANRMPTIVAHFDTLMNEPLPPALNQRLTMPVLVMHGTRTTTAALALAQLMRELLPAAAHEAMPGLGHMGPLADPARVNARLLRFLQAQEPAGLETEPPARWLSPLAMA
ncbi:alpha/beta fold hydrolase [Ideonella sp. YS5]|uniref:alpha/beta fold hydrolase n=1 Tax=Ideonella sp. YS5 TaxID=3453714 RepID=UPI003EEFB19A